MGRVRKYRKIKACDPFAKNRGVDRSGRVYDDPPEIFEEKAKKKMRKLMKFDEAAQDREFQRQALRELRATQPDISSKIEMPTKRERESLKSFSKRVKATTRQLLTEEISKSTSTAKRRKEKMREIKDKKKAKKHGNDSDGDDAIPEFFAREDGVLRPSDLGDVKPEFPQQERIGLWDHAEKPPDNLSYWAAKLKKPKGFRGQEPGAAVLANIHKTNQDSNLNHNNDKSTTKAQPSTQKRTNSSISAFDEEDRKPRIIPGGLRGMMMGNTMGHSAALLESRSLNTL